MSERLCMHRAMVVLLLAADPVSRRLRKQAARSRRRPRRPQCRGSGAQAGGALRVPTPHAAWIEEVAGPQAGLLATRVMYFDFDSSEIKGEGTDVVAAHAKYLAANPATRVRLEGHTDERGSREYNIGLGERRAQAVRRALLLQGAADAQISTVSYGEERPAVPGTTRPRGRRTGASRSSIWRQDRRRAAASRPH